MLDTTHSFLVRRLNWLKRICYSHYPTIIFAIVFIALIGCCPWLLLASMFSAPPILAAIVIYPAAIAALFVGTALAALKLSHIQSLIAKKYFYSAILAITVMACIFLLFIGIPFSTMGIIADLIFLITMGAIVGGIYVVLNFIADVIKDTRNEQIGGKTIIASIVKSLIGGIVVTLTTAFFVTPACVSLYFASYAFGMLMMMIPLPILPGILIFSALGLFAAITIGIAVVWLGSLSGIALSQVNPVIESLMNKMLGLPEAPNHAPEEAAKPGYFQAKCSHPKHPHKFKGNKHHASENDAKALEEAQAELTQHRADFHDDEAAGEVVYTPPRHNS